MTSHAAAGQLQQRPRAREGGLIQARWFDNPVKFIPEGLQLVRSWDLASASDPKTDPDFSVGVLMGLDPQTQLIYIIDVIRGRCSPAELERKIKAAALLDGEEARIRIPQDPGQPANSRRAISSASSRVIRFQSEREEGDKGTAPIHWWRRCEHGFVKLVGGDWNQDLRRRNMRIPQCST